VLEGLAEGLHNLLDTFGIDIPGIKQVVFGAVLLLVVIVLPEGLWPWIARRLGLAERR
jgi:branched-chain amino acid transport system permease protein